MLNWTPGWTPLIIASLKENPELVQMLLRAPNIDVNSVAQDGMTALFEASTQAGNSIAYHITLTWGDVLGWMFWRLIQYFLRQVQTDTHFHWTFGLFLGKFRGIFNPIDPAPRATSAWYGSSWTLQTLTSMLPTRTGGRRWSAHPAWGTSKWCWHSWIIQTRIQMPGARFNSVINPLGKTL